MDLGYSKLYAQLQPDEAGRQHLMNVQSELPGSHRSVPEGQLHMTIIHFGKIKLMYQVLQQVVSISGTDYVENLENYRRNTERLMQNVQMTLQPQGFELYGDSGRTLVLTFAATQQLIELHDSANSALIDFLNACGVPDSQGFMASDHNLRNALTFAPHVTIAKSFEGEVPNVTLPVMAFQATPVRYAS